MLRVRCVDRHKEFCSNNTEYILIMYADRRHFLVTNRIPAGNETNEANIFIPTNILYHTFLSCSLAGFFSTMSRPMPLCPLARVVLFTRWSQCSPLAQPNDSVCLDLFCVGFVSSPPSPRENPPSGLWVLLWGGGKAKGTPLPPTTQPPRHKRQQHATTTYHCCNNLIFIIDATVDIVSRPDHKSLTNKL